MQSVLAGIHALELPPPRAWTSPRLRLLTTFINDSHRSSTIPLNWGFWCLVWHTSLIYSYNFSLFKCLSSKMSTLQDHKKCLSFLLEVRICLALWILCTFFPTPDIFSSLFFYLVSSLQNPGGSFVSIALVLSCLHLIWSSMGDSEKTRKHIFLGRFL